MINLYKKVLAESLNEEKEEQKFSTADYKTVATKEGESLVDVSNRTKISMEKIRSCNPELAGMQDDEKLPAGVDVRIPNDWHPKYDNPEASFKRDWLETGIIDSVRTYCFGKLPIVNLRQIRAAAGALKGTFICGFTFKSKCNPQLPEFKLIFCPKPRSKIYRKDGITRSRWYGMQMLRNATQYNVLNKEFIYKLYSFDIDRFFECPEFKTCCDVFKKNIMEGYKECKKFAQRYKYNIKRSVGKNTKEEDDGNIDEWLVTIKEAADIIGSYDTMYEDKTYFYNDEQKILNLMSARNAEDRDKISAAGEQQTQEIRDKAHRVMATIHANPKNSRSTTDYKDNVKESEEVVDCPKCKHKTYRINHSTASAKCSTCGHYESGNHLLDKQLAKMCAESNEEVVEVLVKRDNISKSEAQAKLADAIASIKSIWSSGGGFDECIEEWQAVTGLEPDYMFKVKI